MSALEDQDFADSTHTEFSRTLDSCQIAWRYKPRTFAIEWDDDGNFVDSLTPDFYLPEYDQYVELASPDQRFTEKNRRVLLLRRHHPQICIKLTASSDFASLIGQLLNRGTSNRDGLESHLVGSSTDHSEIDPILHTDLISLSQTSNLRVLDSRI